MRSSKPPTIATWLLHKVGHTNDALTGDLMEEYLHGRSGAWYWRQVLFAIVVGFGEEIRSHKLLALRAVAVGWAASCVLIYGVELPLWRFYAWVLLTHGLSIGVWWRHYYLYPAPLITWCLAAAAGWTVSRCHRAHREAMVLIFLTSVQLWLLPEFFRLGADALGDRRFLPYLFSHVLDFIVVTIGTLVGGLWGAPRERPCPVRVTAVYEEIAETYYSRRDLASFYSYSDRGISLFPDDVHLLTLTGWVIPHVFDGSARSAAGTLDKAEIYEKHAIEVMGKMPKPEALTDLQFAEFKTEELAVAHSGLGLVYFRRKQYEASAKELQQATSNEAGPDPTDFFVLGADLENLGRFKEAADAFNRCVRLGGNMRDNCKKQPSIAMKRVGDAK